MDFATLPPLIAGAPALTPVMPATGRPTEAAPEPPASPTPSAKAAPLVELLDFVDVAGREVVVPLSFPFRRLGAVVTSITVRRLPTSAISSLVPDGKMPDIFEVYAFMTGLPAPVLRGLDADDGQRVAEVAYGFLPRLFQEALG